PLCTHMRQWTRIIREVACIQNLDTSMLLTIERSDDWTGCPWLTTLIERNLGVIEPETKVILMRRVECGCWATLGDRECLHIEDAPHRHVAFPLRICLQVALIPGNSEGLMRNL